MKRSIQAIFAVVCAVAFAAQPWAQAKDWLNEPKEQKDARMHWWRRARFGMFIHWGLYAVPAGIWKGKEIRGAGEWIMNNARIPRHEYEQLTNLFNPVKYNPDEWVRIAKRAGMKYIVITSKHHDGFCMFNTKATDYNIVKATPYHKDVLKMLSEACKRQGIRFCVYYSIMDWHHPAQAPNHDHVYNPTRILPGRKQEYMDYMKTQLKELITQYDPGILWFDGGWPSWFTREDGVEIYNYVRSLKPDIIINNRLKGVGDYGTPEQHIPATGLPGQDWETCMTMNRTWGYKKTDNNWKSPETLIRNLVDIVSKGGNYLLNIGPTAEGLIPQASVERLEAMGRWIDIYGDAIYGTHASVFPRLSWGRCTTKTVGNRTRLYLLVFNWPTNGRLVVPGLLTDPVSAWLMHNGKSVSWARKGQDVVVMVPKQAPDPICSAVVLEVPGKPKVLIPLPTQDKTGRVTLHAIDAHCYGRHVRYRSGRITRWDRNHDWISWEFKIVRPGTFTVEAELSSPSTPKIKVVCGNQSFTAQCPKTGRGFRKITLGTLTLRPGKHTLEIHPVPQGWKPIEIRSLTLTPVQ